MKVFIGHDSRWDIATQVCAASVRETTPNAEVYRLIQSELPARTPHEARTEFSFLRFLIPWLCGYKGQALYIEQDMLVLDDLNKMAPAGQWQVACVQHAYASKVKRPNWSSVMLLSCDRLRHWTVEAYQTAPRAYLHELECVSEFGALDQRWNVLDHVRPDMGILHFTSGGPWDLGKSHGERARDPKATALWEAAKSRLCTPTALNG